MMVCYHNKFNPSDVRGSKGILTRYDYTVPKEGMYLHGGPDCN